MERKIMKMNEMKREGKKGRGKGEEYRISERKTEKIRKRANLIKYTINFNVN